MEFAVVCVIAFLVSGLTLFSGFGLGTMLMPVFALFFPIPVAIAATAIVHLANNLFKVVLVGRRADWGVVMRFGLPASLAAIIGAGLLTQFAALPILGSYDLAGQVHQITPVKLTIGLLIVGFAVLELSPWVANLSFPSRYLTFGGLLSGFFGGLSGNQGAFRSAFLIKAGLQKEAFIGTGVVCAVIVDTVRLTVYGLSFYSANFDVLAGDAGSVIIAATFAAFCGAFIAKRLLTKIKLRTVQIIVAISLIAVGGGLASGLI